MVELVAQVVERPDFSRHRMLQALAEPAQERYVPDQDLPAVVAAGWHLSSMNRMVDHIPTRVEATQWREFRDTHFTAPEALGEDHTSTLIAATVSAALATRNQTRRLERLSALMERSSLSEQASRELLLEVWERAVALLLEDNGIDMDHEAALLRYARHFGLEDRELDRNGMMYQLIQGAAITEAAAGLMPHRMTFPDDVLTSLRMARSERPVWLFADVDCCLSRQLPEQPASSADVQETDWSHPYYPPRWFAGLASPQEGCEPKAEGSLAVTNHGLHFRGVNFAIRLSHHSVTHLKPYLDGIGAVAGDRPERLLVFRNGDGWFIYNLIMNLSLGSG